MHASQPSPRQATRTQPAPPPRRRTCALAAGAILVAEVAIATVLSDISWIRHQLGDVLAVAGVFFVLMAALPGRWRERPGAVAAGAVGIGFAVAAAQWAHLADRLGLAPESPGGIVLGTTFSTTDLLMYLVGGVAAWLVARTLGRGGRPSTPDPDRA